MNNHLIHNIHNQVNHHLMNHRLVNLVQFQCKRHLHTQNIMNNLLQILFQKKLNK